MVELFKNLVDGEWVGTKGKPNVNPSNTNDVIGEFAVATKQDTLDAIAAARSAFPAWAATVPSARGAILRAASDRLMARRAYLIKAQGVFREVDDSGS